MTDLAFQSTTDLANAIKSRRIKSTELLELYIERMQRHNPKINAIVATDLDNARKQARAADEALAKPQRCKIGHILRIHQWRYPRICRFTMILAIIGDLYLIFAM